ncbi:MULTISPECIES: hypothetical protein [Bacteroidales]|jgi:hypothetical protein|uniref:hypothetical protein n=1 Tax=Bacteroidales TaxID=171549 RepID=UPI000D142978|nr:MULTISPECIES: hypothetical protein [Bacteroidales]PWB10498.1 hypothetical protein C5O72_06815 [Muribaculum intestinale]
MKQNQEITIIPSIALQELRLNDLIGRKAVLVEEDLLPKHLGWWVSLIGEDYLGEREWFIPLSSISE